MPNNLDLAADAAVACAFRDDSEGYDLLVRDFDPLEMRRLCARLATHAADALIAWAADAGATPEQAADIWQRGIMLRAQHDAEREG